MSAATGPNGYIGKNMLMLILTNIAAAIEELPINSNARIGLTMVRDVLLTQALVPVVVQRTEDAP